METLSVGDDILDVQLWSNPADVDRDDFIDPGADVAQGDAIIIKAGAGFEQIMTVLEVSFTIGGAPSVSLHFAEADFATEVIPAVTVRTYLFFPTLNSSVVQFVFSQ